MYFAKPYFTHKRLYCDFFLVTDINYEEKQIAIIKKSIPILIQQINNGNPFRPRFQESQLNFRFFRKSVYNFWNVVTDQNLDMEYEDEAVWAHMFVDYVSIDMLLKFVLKTNSHD